MLMAVSELVLPLYVSRTAAAIPVLPCGALENSMGFDVASVYSKSWGGRWDRDTHKKREVRRGEGGKGGREGCEVREDRLTGAQLSLSIVPARIRTGGPFVLSPLVRPRHSFESLLQCPLPSRHPTLSL